MICPGVEAGVATRGDCSVPLLQCDRARQMEMLSRVAVKRGREEQEQQQQCRLSEQEFAVRDYHYSYFNFTCALTLANNKTQGTGGAGRETGTREEEVTWASPSPSISCE